MQKVEPIESGQPVEKFRLENGVLLVKANLYPYLLREFEQWCARLLRFTNRSIAVDLTACDFISTVFLSSMIKTHLAAQKEDRKLILKIGPSLEQFFIYTSLDKTFNLVVVK